LFLLIPVETFPRGWDCRIISDSLDIPTLPAPGRRWALSFLKRNGRRILTNSLQKQSAGAWMHGTTRTPGTLEDTQESRSTGIAVVLDLKFIGQPLKQWSHGISPDAGDHEPAAISAGAAGS